MKKNEEQQYTSSVTLTDQRPHRSRRFVDDNGAILSAVLRFVPKVCHCT